MIKRLPKAKAIAADQVGAPVKALPAIGPYVKGAIVEYVEAKRLADRAADRRWHLVHAVGRTEDATLKWLKKFKIETYRPTMWDDRLVPKARLSRGQRALNLQIYEPIIVPLFPRYMFVRIDIARDRWQEPMKIAGVVGMVYAGGVPLLVPDNAIDAIKAQEVKGAVPGDVPARLVFSVGENVRVTDGPFAAFNAVVEEGLDVPISAIAGDERIKVAVHIFGRPTPVELHIGQVAKL